MSEINIDLNFKYKMSSHNKNLIKFRAHNLILFDKTRFIFYFRSGLRSGFGASLRLIQRMHGPKCNYGTSGAMTRSVARGVSVVTVQWALQLSFSAFN